jgi:uncharacterized damage-inducible protein DinB
MTTDDLQKLYRYNDWSKERYFAAAERISAIDLTAARACSHGSILGTLRHIVFAEWLWLRRWQGLPREPWAFTEVDLTRLRKHCLDISASQEAFLKSIRNADLEKRITYTNDAGEKWTYTLGDMLQHLVNHSTYHRGQLASLLREIGIAPPPTDFLAYFDCGGS